MPYPTGLGRRRVNAPPWLLAVCVAVFALYALNFLYFFVDDEGIPYVYAQNLLHGHGLSYNAIEGPAEGYSDFLHVCLATLILAMVKAFHQPKISVFFVGKAISFTSGITIVILTWAILRRLRIRTVGTISGMAVVCGSGPIAVWSCSSLETVPFALGVLFLSWALIAGRNGAALVAAGFLALERIDGFIYAGGLLGAFFVCADCRRRSDLLRQIVLPLIALFAVYHCWRYWYFRDFFPAPLEAKVWYKLLPHTTAVVKTPEVTYAVRFAEMYGWAGSAGFALAMAFAMAARGTLRAVALAALVIAIYAGFVGDWMFGFRFFVPLTGLLAVLVASGVDKVSARRPAVAFAMCLAVTAIVMAAAVRFIAAYQSSESTESFLHRRDPDTHRFFHGYFALFEVARTIISVGDVIAYNQAGFVPFMLDVSNIDDLGICSQFYAQMPTTDVFFTEVGRFTPLTNAPVLEAAQAYLLYRNVTHLIVRDDLLRKANHGSVPRELLGGYYERVGGDGIGANWIYTRTYKDGSVYLTDPRAFVENLAHVSRLRFASVNGTVLSRRDYLPRLPFLTGASSSLSFTGSLVIDIAFADANEDVSGITLDEVSCDEPAIAALTLIDAEGVPVQSRQIELVPRTNGRIWTDMSSRTRANRLLLQLSASQATACRIVDLRVLGQSRALSDYIGRTLTFKTPQ